MAVHAAGFRHLLLNEFARRACRDSESVQGNADAVRGIHSSAV